MVRWKLETGEVPAHRLACLASEQETLPQARRGIRNTIQGGQTLTFTHRLWHMCSYNRYASKHNMATVMVSFSLSLCLPSPSLPPSHTHTGEGVDKEILAKCLKSWVMNHHYEFPRNHRRRHPKPGDSFRGGFSLSVLQTCRYCSHGPITECKAFP